METSKKISELLKIATSLKYDNKIDSAITSLRKAYKLIPKSSIDFGIEPYLRLPMYLQISDKSDEAWYEFNQLLAGNYYSENDFAYYSNLAIIHDKCRIFLEREGKHKLALEHKILWYIYDSKHFYVLKTDLSSRKNIRSLGTNTFNNRLDGKLFFLEKLSKNKYVDLSREEISTLNTLWIPVYRLFNNGFSEDEENVLQEVMSVIAKIKQNEH